MPRRKQPLPAPTHQWIDGKRTVGEIVLSMAQDLYKDRENLSRSLNQLAALDELQNREKQFIAQVDAAFAEQNAYQTRQANAGSVNRRVSGSQTADRVEQITDDLMAMGKKVTATAVAAEWRKSVYQKKCFGQPVSDRAIRGYLRKRKLP
jgi:hypothetical protein